MTGIEVSEVAWSERAEECLRIRRTVFVEEQSVPEQIEIDGEDPQCRQFLASLDGDPIGTARLKAIDEGVKIQRVAILKAVRGTGAGKVLMRAMIAAAQGNDIVLDAQIVVMPFYDKLGFVAEGGIFMDAGIPHRRMRLQRNGEP